METLRNFFFSLLAILFFVTANADAQRVEGINQGLLRFQGSLAYGFLNPHRNFTFGDAEFLVTDHIGINGGSYLQQGSAKPDQLFATMSLFGPIWHFTPRQRWDFYAGFQPGFISTDTVELTKKTKVSRDDLNATPAGSICGGVAWYGSFFHAFAQLRMVGASLTNKDYHSRYSDVLIAFGLGFNIDLIRDK